MPLDENLQTPPETGEFDIAPETGQREALNAAAFTRKATTDALAIALQLPVDPRSGQDILTIGDDDDDDVPFHISSAPKIQTA